MEEHGPEENLPWAIFGKDSLYAKRVCRKVAVAVEVLASGWCGAVRHNSRGVN